jgi:hypothetical protein
MALVGSLARAKFGTAYDERAGVVRARHGKDRLSSRMCAVPDSRQRDPHVRFFLERNPGYREGDELVCMADVHRANLNRYAWRVITRTDVAWHA